MAGQTVDYIVRVRGATDASVDQAVAKLKQFVNAQEDVAVSAEKVSRAQLSAEKSLERWSRSLDMNFRQMREMEKLQKDLAAARQQGLITDDQAAVRVAQLTDRHMAASRAQKSLADTTKLSRYEMINLSRQIQDVGVGLASGQSPFTVLIQQGTQIADIFAASQTTVRQFFSNAVGWAGRFAQSTAGVVTGITAIGATAIASFASWESTQQNLTRAVSGLGRASGATVRDLMRIGDETSSLTGLSRGAARDMAANFASVGTIAVENIAPAIKASENLAQTLGISTAEAAKKLMDALGGGRGEIEKLLQSIGAVDGVTRDYLATLDQNINKSGLQAAAIEIIRDRTRDASQSLTTMQKILSAVGNIGVEAFKTITGQTALEAIGTPGDQNIKAQIDAQKRYQEELRLTAQGAAQTGQAQKQFDAAIAESNKKVAELEAQLHKANVAAERAKFGSVFGEEARAIVNAAIPAIKQLEELDKQIKSLQQVRADPKISGSLTSEESKALDESLAKRQVQRRLVSDTREQEANVAKEALKTAEAFKAGSLATSNTLALQAKQLVLAQATTAEQQLQAQEQVRIEELRQTGFNVEDRLKIAANDRANAQAQLSAGLQRALDALKDQEAVAGAITRQEQLAAEERARFNELVRQTNDVEGSRKVAAQERRNAEAAIEAGAQRNLDTLRDQEAVAGAVTGAEKLAAQEQAEFNRLLREGVSEQKAMATAAQQTANAIAGANANAQQQLTSLQQQNQLINAGSEEERARIQSAQTYVNLLNQGVDAMLAQQVAAQQLRNSLDQMAAAQERAAQAAEDQRQANQQSARFIGGSGFAGTRTSGTLGGHQRIENIIKQAEKRGAEVVPLFDFPIGTGVQPFFERETDTSIKNLINDVLRGRGGLTEAINLVKSLPAQNLEDELRNQTLMTLAQHLTEQTGSPAQEISLIQEEISRIRQQPGSLENLAALKALNDRLKQLTESTDALNDTMQIGLDPIYTQGHQALKIGYFDERGGGFRTGTGWVSPSTASQQSLPAAMPGPTTSAGMGSSNFTDSPFGRIFHFAAGGMTAWGKNWDQYRSSYRSPSSGPTVTNTPTLFTTSENYQPELIVPIRTLGNMVSGNSGGNTVANDNSRTTVVNVNVGGGSSMGDRRIRRHIAQGVGRAVAGAM